jgi:uncharacterized membrane protein YhaH (DUF805 family)
MQGRSDQALQRNEQAAMNWSYWIRVFAGFEGRINRQAFWIAVGILMLFELAAESLSDPLLGDASDPVLSLAFTYPEFAIALKRARDRNMSFWWIAVFFAGSIVYDLFTLRNGPIDIASTTTQLLLLPVGVLGLALLIELGFRRGTNGPNRFGPDPLAGQV